MNRLNLVKNFKAYTLRIKDRRKQNIAMLKTYFKKQRTLIIHNTQRRMLRGILWVGLLSVSYYIGHKIYSQMLQVQQMQKKLTKIYPSIVTKISTQGKNQIYYVVPQYDDQLANIIEMCWKYHYKVIVNSDQIEGDLLNQQVNKFVEDIPETVRDKCLIINLQKLKKFDIDRVNLMVKVQSGITCYEFNQLLMKEGFEPVFHEEIAENKSETVYNAIVNNYPSIQGSLADYLVNLDLISSQGQYFRSSNENNQYGSTPNLNQIFLGTGGIFGLPLRVNLKVKLNKKQVQKYLTYQLQTCDLNQKLLATRKVQQELTKSTNILDVQFSNLQVNKLSIKLKGLNTSDESFKFVNQNILSGIQNTNKMSNESIKLSEKKFNIFFNTSQTGFQKFLIFRENNKSTQNTLDFSYEKNLLKINCLHEPLLIQTISQLCSQNSVIVWCKDHKFLREMKKITDQSEVGSELMKILVQIRQGIDHKKIYYTHNRYEEYFAKGTFRKLTEVFW